MKRYTETMNDDNVKKTKNNNNLKVETWIKIIFSDNVHTYLLSDFSNNTIDTNETTINKDGYTSQSFCNVQYTFKDILSVDYFQDNDIKNLVDDYLINILFPDEERILLTKINAKRLQKQSSRSIECFDV
jgi:hypothetical protein